MSIRSYILSCDYHVHTNAGACSRREMTLPNIIRRAERIGYKKLGISDHLGRTDQLPQMKRLRTRARHAKTKLSVYVGCEMGIHENGDPLIPYDDLGFLDYIMVGIGHTSGDVGNCQETPEKWLDGYVKRLERIIAIDYPLDVIVHPLRTLRRHYKGKPLMSHVPLKKWRKLLACLAKKRIAVELNDSCENYETCADAVKSFYTIAHKAGVKFSVASDAHGLDRLGFQVNWVRLAEDLKLTKKDFWSPRRPG